jgi:hypothetical protein
MTCRRCVLVPDFGRKARTWPEKAAHWPAAERTGYSIYLYGGATGTASPRNGSTIELLFPSARGPSGWWRIGAGIHISTVASEHAQVGVE